MVLIGISEVLISISLLFFLLLGVKRIVGLRFCVMCLSVGITWFTMLILYRMGEPINSSLLALLIGMSITGVYYLVEKNTSEKMHLFRVPFIVSLIYAGYYIINLSFSFNALLILLIIWLIFGVIFIAKDKKGARSFVENIIACCRDW